MLAIWDIVNINFHSLSIYSLYNVQSAKINKLNRNKERRRKKNKWRKMHTTKIMCLIQLFKEFCPSDCSDGCIHVWIFFGIS